jgi:hypothetical protein
VHDTIGLSVYREGHHYIVDPLTGCWRWQLFTLRGYPRGSKGAPHRLLYEHMLAPIPANHDLHHTCQNKDCINPAHLVPITHGQHLAQHKRARSKLTAADVRAIRERALQDERLAALAGSFGVGREAVEDIISGRNWRDVGGPFGRPQLFCQLPGCHKRLAGHRAQKYCSHAHRQAAYTHRRGARTRTHERPAG